jgi:hypothetical protein
MENGFRLYYSYDSYMYDPFEKTELLFKSLEGLEAEKQKMITKQDDDNQIIFEDPVPVVLTKDGLKDIRRGDYIVTNDKEEVFLLRKEDFESMYEVVKE